MTIRMALSASAALLTLATGSAFAAGDLPDPSVGARPIERPAGPRPSGNAVSPPVKFLWHLLAPKRKEQEIPAPVVAEPMIILPPTWPEGGGDVPALVKQTDDPEPKSRAIRTAVIPIPRPRPASPSPVVTAAKDYDQPSVVAEGQVAFDEVTGSISAPEPKATVSPPAAIETVPGSPPSPAPIEGPEIVETDDLLLGDPTQFFDDDSGLAPVLPVPDGIAAPRPVTGGPPVAAQPPPSGVTGEPYELVRTLQVLQDQIAQGSTEALTAQRALRAEIDLKFAAADPVVWQDQRNAAAAVTYVLSGGPPTILRGLMALDPKPAIDTRLISGVLAYAEGNESEAVPLLAEINVTQLPPSMGAQLALAKSALAVRTDPKESMRLLAIARLLAPGTLVEEAALRREIFIADQLKDGAAVETLARQYLSRFRNSVYAGNFRNRFAAAISRMNFVKDQAGFSRLDDMLLLVEPESRGQLYLTVALAALVKGNTDAGAFAAERALSLAPAGSGEEARAQLYRAASLVADPKAFDAAFAAMNGCHRDRLAASDQNLHDAVAATIAGIKSGTEVTIAPKKVAQLGGTDSDATETTPLMTRAREALSVTDELVKGMPK